MSTNILLDFFKKAPPYIYIYIYTQCQVLQLTQWLYPRLQLAMKFFSVGALHLKMSKMVSHII